MSDYQDARHRWRTAAFRRAGNASWR
jgi:hypothetical protein